MAAGFSYVLEAEDQFHRAVWYGLLFAVLTSAWFIVGSFLTAADTVATWWSSAAVASSSFVLWLLGRLAPAPENIDDVGDLSEPLTQVRFALALIVLGLAAVVLLGLTTDRPPVGERLAGSALPLGVAALAVGLLVTLLAADAQSFFGEGEHRSLAQLSAR